MYFFTKNIGNCGVLFKGRNPSDLTEDMRTLSLPAGASRNLTSGKAPAKSGTCN
nr:hypothetical protein [uncultured Flavobacterium sp.]